MTPSHFHTTSRGCGKASPSSYSLLISGCTQVPLQRRNPSSFSAAEQYIHNHKIKNLALDQAIIIFYPLPRFYYSHKSNKDLIKRIEVGLVRAYSDGSIGQLWEKHYRRSLDFVNIRARRFFYFDSPLVEGIDFDYQQYFVSLKSDFYDHEPPARNISSQQPLH